jgi:hypothetical protein
MITKDWCSYSIRILRQEFILRDHEPVPFELGGLVML